MTGVPPVAPQTSLPDFAAIAGLHASTGLLYLDHTNRARWMNDAAQRMLGVSLADLDDRAGGLRHQFVTEDGRPFAPDDPLVARVLRTGDAGPPVVLGLPRPHATTWFDVSARPALNGDGGVDGVVVSFVDVSERVRARLGLELRQLQLVSTFRAMKDGVVVQTLNGAIVNCNPAAERMLGLTTDQLAGRTSMDPRWRATHEDGSPFPGDTHPAMVALRTGMPQRDVVMSVHKPDGTRTLISINAEPVMGADGQVAAVVATFADITAVRARERRTEDLLSELADLYNGAPCGYHSLDADGVIVEINDTELAWLGVTREEAVRRLRAFDFLTRESADTCRQHFPALVEGRVDYVDVEGDLVSRQGRTRRVLMRATARRDAEGRFIQSRSALTDITELAETRSTLESALRDRDDLLQNEFVGIARIRDRRFVWISAANSRILGYTPDELAGQDVRMVYPDQASYEAVGRDLHRLLSAHGTARLQVELRHRTGQRLSVDLQAMLRPDGEVLSFITDQTALRDSQHALAQAQRTEAVGRLGAGVAHEFNNLLQTMSGAAEMVLAELPAGHRSVPDLESILSSSARGAALVSQLLSYAQKQLVFPETLSLSSVVEALASDYRQGLRTGVELRVVNGPEPTTIRADRSSLATVLGNLLDNAVDATVADGTVVVHTGQRAFTLTDVAGTPGARVGQFGFVSVSDAGTGMVPAVLERATEPFFTTKAFGRSRGLGLSVVEGVAFRPADGWTSPVRLGRGPPRRSTSLVRSPRYSYGRPSRASGRAVR